jgi:putative endonuclease
VVRSARKPARPPDVVARRAARSHAGGIQAEAIARTALERDGWIIRATRLRTEAGEIDLLAEKSGLLAVVEVKSRRTLSDAAAALGKRQQARLRAAAEIVAGAHPEWCSAGLRFDLILVDAAGTVRRIRDAFREGD